GAIRYCLRWAERRAVRAARHRNDERSITAHLRRPTDAAPFRARNAAVKNSGPRAAGRNTGQRAAGHVAVVVEIAAEISRGEIDCADARYAVRTERSKIRIDTRNCATVVVRRPNLARAVDGHAGWTTLNRDRADVTAVILQMAHGAAIQRVCHPHVVLLVDHAALCERVALVEDPQQRAVRRELPDLTVTKRRVPNVTTAVDTKAVTRMVEAGPIRS